MRIPGLWFLISCSRPDALAELETYRQVIAAPGDDAAAAFARCADLRDDKLAGDCGLALAQHYASTRRESIATWCGEVSRGTWRYECNFLASEEQRRAGNAARAGELCLDSGPFVDDCVQHLWQGEVRRVIHVPRQAPDFAGRLPLAQKVYARWATVLDREPRWSERFWLRYYQNGFESAIAIDLGWCDPLPDEQKVRCVEAARQSLIADLAPRIVRSNGMAEFCALEKPDTVALGRWMRLAPSPVLDEVIAQRQAEICAEQRPR